MPITPCKTTVFNPKGNKKPKGLSMRSNSDMNVFHSTLLSSAKENIYNSKELKNSKPKTVKLDNSGLQTHSLKVILSKVIKLKTYFQYLLKIHVYMLPSKPEICHNSILLDKTSLN